METSYIILAQLFVFGLFVIFPVVGGVWCVARFRKSAPGLRRKLWGTGIGIFTGYFLFLTVLLFHAGPWHSKILVQGASPNGQEYCVVQSFQALPEPYRVSFYIRDASGVWHWNYLAHEDLAWRSAKVEFRDQIAVVSREGAPAREIPLPTNSVDIATVLGGYRNHYCPANFTVAEVFKFHSRD